MHSGNLYLKQGSNNYLKQFLYFFFKDLWEKVDVYYKSLNKSNLVFYLKFIYKLVCNN